MPEHAGSGTADGMTSVQLFPTFNSSNCADQLVPTVLTFRRLNVLSEVKGSVPPPVLVKVAVGAVASPKSLWFGLIHMLTTSLAVPETNWYEAVMKSVAPVFCGPDQAIAVPVAVPTAVPISY